MRQITLMYMMPDEADATSFYRAKHPLSLLRKSMNLTFINSNAWNYSTVAPADVVFMQRPFTPQHLQVAEIVKNNRKPLWVDYDDDLFSVPKWNPTSAVYNKDEIQKNVAQICAMADIVSVSTQALAERIAPLNKNIRVINNGWHDELLPYEPPPTERHMLISWRGSNTHRKDLSLIAESVMNVARKYPQVTWMFVGENPWFTDFMDEKQFRFIPPMDPIQYFSFMKKSRPAIHFTPLVDCPFNRSKSNISHIEATWAGAVSVAPDFEEWRVPGCVNYKTPEHFAQILENMIEGFDYEAQQKIAWKHIDENLRLSKLNEHRKQILLELAQ